jgi:hypothetical protein
MIKFINNYKLETNIKTKNRQEENWIHVILFSSVNLCLHKKFLLKNNLYLWTNNNF